MFEKKEIRFGKNLSITNFKKRENVMAFITEIFSSKAQGRAKQKMSKTTNKHQIDILINLMQNNVGIARGFYKGGKEELNRFWRKAECELNSAGPPTKSVAEWKKVWADQKKYVRHKAAQNLKHSKGTGGGPNIEIKFSATEIAIYELIGMKESVEGVAQVFGLNSKSNLEAHDVQLEPEETLLERIDEAEAEFQQEGATFEMEWINLDESAVSQQHISPTKPQSRKEATKQKDSTDILLEELKIQRELCDTIKEAIVGQDQNMKKLYRAVDNIYAMQKSHFKEIERIKLSTLEEIKRHNLAMERFQLKKIEAKLEENRLLTEMADLRNQLKKN